jgi:hypothetical protein
MTMTMTMTMTRARIAAGCLVSVGTVVLVWELFSEESVRTVAPSVQSHARRVEPSLSGVRLSESSTDADTKNRLRADVVALTQAQNQMADTISRLQNELRQRAVPPSSTPSVDRAGEIPPNSEDSQEQRRQAMILARRDRRLNQLNRVLNTDTVTPERSTSNDRIDAEKNTVEVFKALQATTSVAFNHTRCGDSLCRIDAVSRNSVEVDIFMGSTAENLPWADDVESYASLVNDQLEITVFASRAGHSLPKQENVN